MAREFRSIGGAAIRIPDPERLIHLQFRRFAGCPVCNLHLQSITRRHAEIEAAGIREVVIFHSSVQDLLVHTGRFPFDVVADPEKALYKVFGVEMSARALLDPRAWGAIVGGIIHSGFATVARGAAMPPIRPDGGSLGLPADFLVARDGTVLASSYGRHADDQWSVEALLDLARASAEQG